MKFSRIKQTARWTVCDFSKKKKKKKKRESRVSRADTSDTSWTMAHCYWEFRLKREGDTCTVREQGVQGGYTAKMA